MRREENWAIEEGRIRTFFAAQPDVTQTAEGFAFGGCQIRLIPVSGQLLGKWQQQRTIVIMDARMTTPPRSIKDFSCSFCPQVDEYKR